MGVGVIVGCITIFNPQVTVHRIGRNVIDSNILRSISPRAGFGSFIVARLLEFALTSLFIFILCQTGFTSLFAFGLIGFRACTVTVNLYWIIARLGAMGFVLFLCYLVFFLVLLVLLAASSIFIMKQCAIIRSYGFRRGICWKNFWITMTKFATVTVCIALLEWLCFWLIFSKIIWPTVFPIVT
jgi:hypothetical protein